MLQHPTYTIKQRPEEFKVDEVPLYAPSGEGEHIYIGVRKTNVSHEELIRRVAKSFGVKRHDVGSAGRKDLHAVTTQVLSVYLPTGDMMVPELGDGIDVLWSTRHENKLRTGHLIGNRFDITVRDVNPAHIVYVNQKLKEVTANGLPNLYGSQRFGNDGMNPKIGKLLLQGSWEECVNVLRTSNARFTVQWNDDEPHKLCKNIPKSMRKLYLNAFQSKLFNDVLRTRQEQGLLNTCLVGDLVWAHVGKGSAFELDEDELASDTFVERMRNCQVSATGPLFGIKMRQSSGKPLEIEQRVLAESGVTAQQLEQVKQIMSGSRRPLRVPVSQPTLTSGVDDHGDFIRVQFELPAGSYATVLIDELLNVSP
ncbi:MAG: tRNA pseudouridine(13) synthase TruD [Planctomycetota bacterium]|nr:tRNA pseudouridine(13) synthase TruD [Planctomycetota bacterium]